MEHVAIDEWDSDSADSELGRNALSEALGTTDVAINYYRLGAGEQLPSGLHAHVDQEEVFVVLDGRATFETYATESTPADVSDAGGGEITVDAGEVVRFELGEFQSGRNGGDEPLRILALGAPRETEDVRIPISCPECGHDDLRLPTDDTGLTFVCPDCGAVRVPEPCPDCGGGLQMALDDEGNAIAACTDCGTELATPPLRA